MDNKEPKNIGYHDVETFIIALNMQKHGEPFWQGIGQSLVHACPANVDYLRSCYPKEFIRFSKDSMYGDSAYREFLLKKYGSYELLGIPTEDIKAVFDRADRLNRNINWDD